MFDLKAGEITCPKCKCMFRLGSLEIIGAHVCSRQTCPSCQLDFLTDLPTAHGAIYPLQLDIRTNSVFRTIPPNPWGGEALENAWGKPCQVSKDLIIEKKYLSDEVVFVPCIDHLYGHSVLKLLSITEHIKNNIPVIVLVPNWLRWMVPDNVCEVWSVDIPLRNGEEYFPHISHQVRTELLRFQNVKLGEGKPHPKVGSTESFTRVQPHSWESEKFRISYVWRDDRLWVPDGIIGSICHHFPLIGRQMQKCKVLHLMKLLRKKFPSDIKFAIVGVGKPIKIPDWIDNKVFSPPIQTDMETQFCQIYSESRAVIGIHGSNMLLPSWHAGATMDLMPNERWGNFGQDILFRDINPRHTVLRHRFTSMSSSVPDLAIQIVSMIRDTPIQMHSFQ